MKAENQTIDAFELWCWRRLENSLDFKEIKPVNPKGNQSWIFIRRTDAEAEAPILWSPDVKSWLIRKDPDAGKDWGQEEKGTTEDKMVGWHLQFSGHEFEQTVGYSEGQGSLACCSPWGRKELDMTEQLNSNHTPTTIKLKKNPILTSSSGDSYFMLTGNVVWTITWVSCFIFSSFCLWTLLDSIIFWVVLIPHAPLMLYAILFILVLLAGGFFTTNATWEACWSLSQGAVDIKDVFLGA